MGKSDLASKMNSTSNIGSYSVGIGAYAAASATGAVNISSPTTLTYSDASGEDSVIIASFQTITKDKNAIALAAQNFYNIGTNNIILSSRSLGSDVKSEDSVFLNGINTGSKYNNAVVGGYNTSSAKGNNSFLLGRVCDRVPSAMLINLYPWPNHTTWNQHQFFESGDVMNVNGKVIVTQFEGYGHLLTGDIQTSYLKVPINGIIENIYPTNNKLPKSIYVSDINGFLPDGVVSSASIKDGTIEAADIDGYSIGTHKFKNNTLKTDNFANGSISNSKLVLDDLGEINLKTLQGTIF